MDDLKPHLVSLGPHPERKKEEPAFELELDLRPIKPHHYFWGAVVAVIVGLSATYGIIQAGTLAVNHLLPHAAEEAANNYSPSESQGSDDSNNDVLDPLSGSYTILNSHKPLYLSAQDYIVGDLSTSDVILEKKGTTTSPMASVTKLMTAVIDLETINQRDYATVTPATLKYYGVRGELVPNEIIRISDLIYPLLVVSSNVAAEVFADHVGRSTYLKEMNDKAIEIGMKNSNYDDPSGLSPKSYSTAEDLFRLARYIKENHPEIFDIGRVREYSILGHTWINQNHQLVYTTFGGGKNGFTDQAAKTTVSTFNLSFNSSNKNDKRPIVIVLLHTNDREGDIAKILSYLSVNVRYDAQKLDVGSNNAPAPQPGNNPDQ
jgi:D-alanyl-D-alanine carboxypeptidase (penicillin-binding protein 5/6)